MSSGTLHVFCCLPPLCLSTPSADGRRCLITTDGLTFAWRGRPGCQGSAGSSCVLHSKCRRGREASELESRTGPVPLSSCYADGEKRGEERSECCKSVQIKGVRNAHLHSSLGSECLKWSCHTGRWQRAVTVGTLGTGL